MKVRKKPVEVEAIQWKPLDMLIYEVMKFMGIDKSNMKDKEILAFGKYKGELTIETLEGIMTVSDGDWIIKGVKGEFYPCKPDIFAETYEVIEP